LDWVKNYWTGARVKSAVGERGEIKKKSEGGKRNG